MAISITDARGLFTKKVLDIYLERPRPTGFLRSLFRTEVSPTKEISIEAERGFELVAKDVIRGTEGNRNTFSRSTEKIFVPPYFREYTDITQLALYEQVLGQLRSDRPELFARLANSVADRMTTLQDTIERAYELMCVGVIEDGIVTAEMISASINYFRKATSKVMANDAGIFGSDAGFWSVGATDLFAQIAIGCTFLRTIGKSMDTEFMLVMGSAAKASMFKNTTFLGRQNLFNFKIDSITGPARQSDGYATHGRISCGDYGVTLITYPQYYDLLNADGTKTATPYLNPKKVTLLPMNPRFIMAHAQVPKLITAPGEMPNATPWTYMNFPDERKATHEFDVQSCGMPMPVAVDQMWTAQVLA